ncbi:MAG: hypothetical protein O7A98_03430 [Acidobacteria bacterium]|nr:hypothetical protein [Acidobacteriota bacterium]
MKRSAARRALVKRSVRWIVAVGGADDEMKPPEGLFSTEPDRRRMRMDTK